MRTSLASHAGRSQRVLAAAALLCLPAVLAGLVLDARRVPPTPRGPATSPPAAGPHEPVLPPTRTTARRPASSGEPVADLAPDPAQAPALRRRRDRSRWRERDHYEHFLELPAGELATAAGPLLSGESPDYAKVALLRALDEADPEAAAPWFGWVLRELPDETRTAGMSVPAFVVRRLSAEAPHDSAARDVLWDATFGAQRMAQSLRGRAASALAANASEGELSRLAAELDTETDPLVRAGVLQALRSNPEQEAVRRWFARSEAENDATSRPSSES